MNENQLLDYLYTSMKLGVQVVPLDNSPHTIDLLNKLKKSGHYIHSVNEGDSAKIPLLPQLPLVLVTVPYTYGNYMIPQDSDLTRKRSNVFARISNLLASNSCCLYTNLPVILVGCSLTMAQNLGKRLKDRHSVYSLGTIVQTHHPVAHSNLNADSGVNIKMFSFDNTGSLLSPTSLNYARSEIGLQPIPIANDLTIPCHPRVLQTQPQLQSGQFSTVVDQDAIASLKVKLSNLLQGCMAGGRMQVIGLDKSAGTLEFVERLRGAGHLVIGDWNKPKGKGNGKGIVSFKELIQDSLPLVLVTTPENEDAYKQAVAMVQSRFKRIKSAIGQRVLGKGLPVILVGFNKNTAKNLAMLLGEHHLVFNLGFDLKYRSKLHNIQDNGTALKISLKSYFSAQTNSTAEEADATLECFPMEFGYDPISIDDALTIPYRPRAQSQSPLLSSGGAAGSDVQPDRSSVPAGAGSNFPQGMNQQQLSESLGACMKLGVQLATLDNSSGTLQLVKHLEETGRHHILQKMGDKQEWSPLQPDLPLVVVSVPYPSQKFSIQQNVNIAKQVAAAMNQIKIAIATGGLSPDLPVILVGCVPSVARDLVQQLVGIRTVYSLGTEKDGQLPYLLDCQDTGSGIRISLSAFDLGTGTYWPTALKLVTPLGDFVTISDNLEIPKRPMLMVQNAFSSGTVPAVPSIQPAGSVPLGAGPVPDDPMGMESGVPLGVEASSFYRGPMPPDPDSVGNDELWNFLEEFGLVGHNQDPGEDLNPNLGGPNSCWSGLALSGIDPIDPGLFGAPSGAAGTSAQPPIDEGETPRPSPFSPGPSR